VFDTVKYLFFNFLFCFFLFEINEDFDFYNSKI
jgi:hypothetical protein